MLGAREPESKHHATLRLLGSDAKHRFHLGTETKAYKESHLRGLCHLVGFGEDMDAWRCQDDSRWKGHLEVDGFIAIYLAVLIVYGVCICFPSLFLACSVPQIFPWWLAMICSISLYAISTTNRICSKTLDRKISKSIQIPRVDWFRILTRLCYYSWKHFGQLWVWPWFPSTVVFVPIQWRFCWESRQRYVPRQIFLQVLIVICRVQKGKMILNRKLLYKETRTHKFWLVAPSCMGTHAQFVCVCVSGFVCNHLFHNKPSWH